MHPNQHNIFSVPIWGFVLNSQHYHTYDYCDRLLEIESKEPSAKKSNIGGYQTRDNLHKTEGVFKEFINEINAIANSITSHYTTKEVGVVEMWGNINYRHNCNGSHVHAGILSGVFYCQVPENSGELVFLNPAVRSFNSPIRNSDFYVKPDRLALIIFPSWLEHYVGPNLSDDKRISISFNIG